MWRRRPQCLGKLLCTPVQSTARRPPSGVIPQNTMRILIGVPEGSWQGATQASSSIEATFSTQNLTLQHGPKTSWTSWITSSSFQKSLDPSPSRWTSAARGNKSAQRRISSWFTSEISWISSHVVRVTLFAGLEMSIEILLGQCPAHRTVWTYHLSRWSTRSPGLGARASALKLTKDWPDQVNPWLTAAAPPCSDASVLRRQICL